MKQPTKRRLLAALAAGSALAFAATGTMTATAASTHGGGVDPNTDATRTHGGVDQTSAIVQLSQAPLATSPRTAPGNGKQIDFRSAQVKNERAKLAAQRNAFKRWLRANAPDAKITSEYDVAINAVAVRLNGTPLSALRAAPDVVSASYEGLYTPTADSTADSTDPDLSLINALDAWNNPQVGGEEYAGTGIQVGIVDTGIDITHPCFDDEGFDAQQLGDKRFTNNKVIVAKVFANKAANLGYTAEAVQDHGTHVAGTVACNYQTPASVAGVAIPYAPSGVAPAAQLGSYNVFPGDIENARSEDILNALQAAAEDGMDVINMSLGGGASGIQDLLTMAVDNLDRANIVVAVSAGNEGPGHYTVGSPGSAERALTAGASSVGQYVGTPILDGTGTQVAVAAIGDFPTPNSDLTGTLVASGGGTLGTGCVEGTYDAPIGQPEPTWIALVSRGGCTFGTKVAMAEKAGAKATIVVNNAPGDPIAMGADPAFATTIAAVMVAQSDKQTLVSLAGTEVAIGADKAYTATRNDNIMASFSSQGPTDVDYRVKPDLVAPGVNVLSSIPKTFCEDPGITGCWAFFQGTSMASPHLAGTAAVVRSAHSGWSAEQVRSAITNTAQQGELTQSEHIGTLETDPLIIGAGLDDVAAAVSAQVALSSVSTSFGAVPQRSGKPLARQLTITNLTDGALTLPVSIDGADADAFGTDTSSVSLPGGGSKTITLRFDPAAVADHAGHSWATLHLGDGSGEVAHTVLYGFVK